MYALRRHSYHNKNSSSIIEYLLNRCSCSSRCWSLIYHPKNLIAVFSGWHLSYTANVTFNLVGSVHDDKDSNLLHLGPTNSTVWQVASNLEWLLSESRRFPIINLRPSYPTSLPLDQFKLDLAPMAILRKRDDKFSKILYPNKCELFLYKNGYNWKTKVIHTFARRLRMGMFWWSTKGGV